MRARSIIVGLVAICVATPAHDVITTPLTFSREISRLIDNRCAECHRPGGRAFSLLTYQDARPWAAAIKEEVLERRMPPWGAVKGFGEFRDDRGLTQEQVGLIADWVEGGAPEGDPKLRPSVPKFHGAGRMRTAKPLAISGAYTLRSPTTLIGIRPGKLPAGTTLTVVAERPDGSTEPLLWLYQFNPKFAHDYWYAAPLQFPAGTRIQMSPAVGGLALLMK
jgi:hypothetical protein